MKEIKRKLMIGTLGLASFLAGCGTTHEKLLSGKIDGVEIKFVRHVDPWTNKTTMEIYDSKGNLKAQLDYSYMPNGFVDYDDERVEVNRGIITRNEKKKNYVEKE